MGAILHHRGPLRLLGDCIPVWGCKPRGHISWRSHDGADTCGVGRNLRKSLDGREPGVIVHVRDAAAFKRWEDAAAP